MEFVRILVVACYAISIQVREPHTSCPRWTFKRIHLVCEEDLVLVSLDDQVPSVLALEELELYYSDLSTY
jgi:hypothetical protein